MSLNRDFVEFIECLNARRVEYLLVGGYALAFHGRLGLNVLQHFNIHIDNDGERFSIEPCRW